MRIRGTAFQVNEKYQALARDASASGDRIMAENYLQHAEHYYRIIAAINEAQSQQSQQSEGRDGSGHRHRDNGHRGNSHRDQAHRENGHQGGRGDGAAEAPPVSAAQPEIGAEVEFGKDPRQDDARESQSELANGEAVVEVVEPQPALESDPSEAIAAKSAGNGADREDKKPSEARASKPRRRGPGRPRKSASAKESATPASEANPDGD